MRPAEIALGADVGTPTADDLNAQATKLPVESGTGRPAFRRLSLDDGRWLELVRELSAATAFHHPAWARMLGDCYSREPFVAGLVEEDGSLAAGLPVLESERLGHRRWASLPYTDACAPLGTSGDVSRLVTALGRERSAGRVESIEIRSRVDAGAAKTMTRGVVHRLPLSGDPTHVAATFSSNVRRSIARAARERLVVRQGTRSDLIDTFYRLHLQTRRRQGVPIQPPRFFELLWDRMLSCGLGFVLLVEARGEPVAGAVFLAWNRTLTYKFGASDSRYWPLRPNHALFADAIRRGCEGRFDLLDLGRTDLGNDGLRAFKSGWGATESALTYSRLGPMRDGRLDRFGGVLAPVIRHSPSWVCRSLGFALYRYAG